MRRAVGQRMRALFGIGLAGSTSVVGVRTVSSETYWFDESGQYWMAQGQTHFAGANTPTGGVAAVLQANATANLDPGGFTLILRAWTEVLPPASMKFVPFIFGVAAVAFAVLVLHQVAGIAPSKSLLAGSIFLMSPLLRQYVFELRPYTMEASAALLGALASVLPVDFWTRRLRAVGLGSTLAILATSRYSALIPAAVAVLIVVLTPTISRGARVLFAASVAPAGIFSLWMLSRQNPAARPPSYVDSLILSSPQQFLSTAVFDPEVMWLFMALFFVLIIYVAPAFTGVTTFSSSSEARLGLFAALCVSAFAILSLLGFYPFGAKTRWDMTLHVVLYLCVAALVKTALRVMSGGPTLTTSLAVSIMSILLLVGFAPPVKEQIPEAAAACLDSSRPLIINEGAWPTYRLYAEVLRARPLLGAPQPSVYREYSQYEGRLAGISEVATYDQILLSFFNTEDLEVFAQTHQVCFSSSETVFLARISSSRPSDHIDFTP